MKDLLYESYVLPSPCKAEGVASDWLMLQNTERQVTSASVGHQLRLISATTLAYTGDCFEIEAPLSLMH